MAVAGEVQIDTPRWAVPLLSPSRYKGAHGGRGSGKSHFFAELLVEQSVLNKDLSSVCIREVQRTLKQSSKRLIEKKIQALNVGYYFEVLDSIIRRHDGNGIIIFEGMQNHNADSIKSLEDFDIAWFEEAQNCSERSLTLLRPTIRKDPNPDIGYTGSELWFGWNPSQPSDPVDALLRGDNKPPGAVVVEVNYTDNPWFPDVLRREMEYDRSADIEKYQHVWLGGYEMHSEARVFKNWRVEEFEAPADAIHRLGADWGFSVDPSVMIRCHIIGRKLYIDYEAYMVGCETVDLPDLFRTIPDSELWPSTADSSRPETISHLRKNGYPKMFPSVKGKGSVKEGIEWLQSYEIIVHPRCIHTIDELTIYRYKTDPDTGKVLPLLSDKDNHVIDALNYACEGVRRAHRANKVETVSPRPIKNFWNG